MNSHKIKDVSDFTEVPQERDIPMMVSNTRK